MCEIAGADHIHVTGPALVLRDIPWGLGPGEKSCVHATFTPLAWSIHMMMRTGLTGSEAYNLVKEECRMDMILSLESRTVEQWITQVHIPKPLHVAISAADTRKKAGVYKPTD